MDSGATDHLTNQLDNLHHQNLYIGTYEIIIGDGSTIPITHTGKVIIPTETHSSNLPKVLHVPHISQNPLSVSSLCHTNPVSVEFFSNNFLIKDMKTRVPLLKGLHKNGLYHMPPLTTSPTAFTTINSSSPPWHHIFGHPCERTMRHLSSINKIKTSKLLPCISCSSSKSHKLPFTFSSIVSKRPLEIIYSDV